MCLGLPYQFKYIGFIAFSKFHAVPHCFDNIVGFVLSTVLWALLSCPCKYKIYIMIYCSLQGLHNTSSYSINYIGEYKSIKQNLLKKQVHAFQPRNICRVWKHAIYRSKLVCLFCLTLFKIISIVHSTLYHLSIPDLFPLEEIANFFL